MACMDNSGTGTQWQRVIMIFNCSERSVEVALPAGNWQILADGEDSLRWKKETLVTQKTPVAEYSAQLLGLKA